LENRLGLENLCLGRTNAVESILRLILVKHEKVLFMESRTKLALFTACSTWVLHFNSLVMKMPRSFSTVVSWNLCGSWLYADLFVQACVGRFFCLSTLLNIFLRWIAWTSWANVWLKLYWVMCVSDETD